MLKMFEQCPACGGPFVITSVRCADCHTEIRGEFASGGLSGLSEDQVTFLKVFVRARGNLTEVEKNLGVSYPTIRNKLDALIKAIDKLESTATDRPAVPGSPANRTSTPEPDGEREQILAQIAAGEISPAQGLERLARISESEQISQTPKGE